MQEPRAIACILGGSQAPASHRVFKQFAREVNAALPMLCSPVISNVTVTKTLIDGGAGLNVLSVQTFDRLPVPYYQLHPTKPFSGVTDGSTHPIG